MPSRVHLVVALVVLGGAAGLGVAALRAPPPPQVVAEPAAASARAKSPEHHHVPPGHSLPPPATTTAESVERHTAGRNADGALTTLTVTTPPFEITRRYKSMEGPYATIPVRVDGTASPGGGKAPKRELWWWKGARIEMLDEHGAPLDQEFMCHANVDADVAERAASLGVRRSTPRLVTLTQGELAFSLPEGRGLPVASDETWSIMFQVLNHNRDGVFHVKQRLVLTFVREADRTAPIAAVEPYAGSIWVPLEEAAAEPHAEGGACPCCAPPVLGVEAASNVRRLVDEEGITLAGHWVVPPGRHTWSYPLLGGLGRPRSDKRIYATWTHVHPFATEVRLLAHDAGSCGEKVVTTTAIDSLTDGRVGLANIRSLSSKEGVPVPAAGSFEIAVAYDNPTARDQDSMTSLGVYVSADDFKPPAWAR